jgi:hypothetical protein
MRHHIFRRAVNLTFAFLLAVFSVNLSGVLALQTAQADSFGNSGTIKIAEDATGGGFGNDPHITGCNLDVNFYGYSHGTHTGTVTIEAHSPTDTDQLVSPTGPQPVSFNGSSNGNDLNKQVTYMLLFSGQPATKGYHIKITADANGTQGGPKQKTIWVQGCEQPDGAVTYGAWSNGSYTCGDENVIQTRTKTVTPYKWNGTTWVLDAANATVTTETQTRLPTSDELMNCTTKPDDEVTYGDWTDGTFTCGDVTVLQTRTKTVTTHTWNGTEWVLDAANATTTNETQTRLPTSDELKSCAPKPDDKVTYGDWTDGLYRCGDFFVTQTQTVTTTPYTWNGTTWVLDAANATTSTNTKHRLPTSQELKDCSPQPADVVINGQWSNGTYTCGAESVVQTRTVTHIPYKWIGFMWVLDFTHLTFTTETQTRQPTSHELKKCSPQPDSKVEYGSWTDEAYECGSQTVEQTRTKTVTPYKWNGTEWVLAPNHSVTTTEYQYREPTSDELKSCAPQPEDNVQYGEWVDGNYECGNEVVDQTRTKTVTPYVWNGTEWILDTQNATTTTETQARDVNADNDPVLCPVDTPAEADPAIVDICGTDVDSFTITPQTGVIYKWNGDVLNGTGPFLTNGALSVTITAEAEAGYVLVGPTSWTYAFTNNACEPGRGSIGGDTPLTPSTPAKLTGITLPDTGSNPLQQLITVIIAGLLTYGATFFLVSRRDLSQK